MTAAMSYYDALDFGTIDRGTLPAQEREGANVSVRDLTRLLHIDCPDEAWLARTAFALRRVREGDIALVMSLLRPEPAYRDTLERGIRAAMGRLQGVRSFDLKFDAATPGGRRLPEKEPIRGVKHLVAVASGKGGVGKTTVAVNLAIALQKMGSKVGLMDADVYGPNVPLMLGTTEQPRAVAENVIIPVETYALKVISMGRPSVDLARADAPRSDAAISAQRPVGRARLFDCGFAAGDRRCAAFAGADGGDFGRGAGDDAFGGGAGGCAQGN